ncbi:hypothetical protein [Asanoa sp. NPDC050611]|uniref:hypothetical protein n=1 Tax=Asanoa sp. NPDC050611 TaxID=3157098 RepID=UPI0033F8ADDD
MGRTGQGPQAGKNALWVLAGHAVVLGVCIAGIFTQSDTVPDGQCEGPGSSCPPSPRGSAFLALIFFGAPALTISLVVCLVTVAIVAAVRDGPTAGTNIRARHIGSR